jgi:hypothetical protein
MAAIMTTETTPPPIRTRLDDERYSITHEFEIITEAETHSFKITCGIFPSGRLGEVFMEVGKEGAQLTGMIDALAISLSIGLQHGVPLESYTTKFRYMCFDPAGFVQGVPILLLQSISYSTFIAKSPVDYLAAYLDWKFPAGMLREPDLHDTLYRTYDD